MRRSDLSETSNLSTRALQFLLDLPDLDAPGEELIRTLCVSARKLSLAPSWVAPSLTARRLHSTGFFFLACRELVLEQAAWKPDCATLRRNMRSGGV